MKLLRPLVLVLVLLAVAGGVLALLPGPDTEEVEPLAEAPDIAPPGATPAPDAAALSWGCEELTLDVLAAAFPELTLEVPFPCTATGDLALDAAPDPRSLDEVAATPPVVDAALEAVPGLDGALFVTDGERSALLLADGTASMTIVVTTRVLSPEEVRDGLVAVVTMLDG